MTSKDGNPAIYARTFSNVVLWLEVMPVLAKSRMKQANGSPEDETEPAPEIFIYGFLPAVTKVMI
jgi:hypothetical protein